MNALMHRDYETNAPVQFYEYDDRIEVQNPGGLYGKVTPENFPNVSDYRNPFIAEAMKVLGYVNRFSRGVYRVQKELIENGNGKAVFDFSLVTAFRVIENVSEKYLEEGFGAEKAKEKPKKHPRNIQETSKKRPRNYQETTQVTTQETTQEKPKKSPRKAQEKPKKSPRKIEEEIMMIMENNPQVTRKELAKKLDRTEDSIRYYLRKMTKQGIIKHEGPTKSGKWVIIK
jgi:ATP-dependent DNA helicase RecG